jgi:hypothetical protein
MANYSIPNSTPAIGRTLTPLSRRSRKQNSSSACFSSTSILAHAIASWPLGFFNSQRPTPNAQRPIGKVRCWMLGVESWAFSVGRVKGAWWSSRSSKPLSVPYTRDRGRFDSYPLRLVSFVILSGAKRSRRIRWNCRWVSQRDSSTSLGMTRTEKGGDLDVA